MRRQLATNEADLEARDTKDVIGITVTVVQPIWNWTTLSY